MWQYVRIAMAAIAMSVLPIGGALAKSLALVIGNDSYAQLPMLEKARADARGYAAHFQGLGFEVTLVLDANSRSMDEAPAAFYDRISSP